MGFLDDVKNKLDGAGDQAEDVFEAAKRQAVAAIDDLKAKLDVDDDGEHTVGEVFAAAKDQASGAIESLKAKVSGDDSTTVGEARVLSEETATNTPAPTVTPTPTSTLTGDLAPTPPTTGTV